jgi:predicted NBD/HSP70 family sugar kinase
MNDATARRIYDRSVALLAFGVVGTVNTFNPDIVVFADRISKGGDSFLPNVKRVLQKHLVPEIYEGLQVDICHIEDDASLLGASIAAFDQLLAHPTDIFS